jgi:hypothetical protein
MIEKSRVNVFRLMKELEAAEDRYIQTVLGNNENDLDCEINAELDLDETINAVREDLAWCIRYCQHQQDHYFQQQQEEAQ